jgi:hypothetical protein
MLDAERQYFEQHREELLRQYPGKFVVIKEDELLGSFDNIQDALGAGARQFGMSPFLVRRTDERPQEISIPALTLGILRAHTDVPVGGASSNP